MLFQTTKTLKRILYLDPINNNSINSLDVDIKNEGTIEGNVLFSYSFDDVNWSDYKDSDTVITELTENDNNSLTTYLRILFSVQEKENTTFSPEQYNHSCIEAITVNNENVGVCGIEYYKEIKILRNDNNSNQYNPYRGVENIHHLREQLSESIMDTFGVPSTYFVRVPQEDTKSIIWKSYKVHDTLEPKEIKVMLSIDDEYNGDVQSYQYYTDYENLEVEITKETWQKVFGEILPTPKDSIYINLFQKMFRVVQVKEDRNFMNRAVAYKFYLGKHIEGVEINNGDNQENVDDFTEFLAYDLETSDDAIDEIETATGIQDSIEFTKEDRDTVDHNTNSKLIDYSKGMKSVETGLVYNGVNFQRYMYQDVRETPFLTKYDISSYSGETYTASVWSKIVEVGSSIKVFEIGNDAGSTELIYINTNGYVTANVTIDDSTNYITATGEPITNNGYYGLNYSRMGETVIISVVKYENNNITIVQEIVTTNITKLNNRNIFTILADKNIMSGNIRFGKKSLSKSKLIQYVTDYSPNAKEYVVIDNNNPTVTGIKVK